MSRQPDPSPLGEAADGFAGLATWFTKLVGDQVTNLARAIDQRTFDADAAAAATARMATLPLLGLSALVNEVFDAATVVTTGVVRERSLTSLAFHTEPARHRRELALDGPLTNGFGQGLQAAAVRVSPAVLDDGQTEFTIAARGVRPECVGVYRGRVTVVRSEAAPTAVAAAPGGKRQPIPTVDVWLVVS